MGYLYVLFPFIVWTISQTIKFAVRLARSSVPHELKGFLWTYIWAGGPPSTHTAILSSTLVLVWHHYGLSPVLTLAIVITILWVYDMANEHKKQRVYETYFVSDGSVALQKIASDGRVLDLSGHAVLDIILGAILGFTLGLIGVHTVLA